MEEVDSIDLHSYGFCGDREMVELGEEVSSVSHPSEGILLVNPKSIVKEGDLGKLSYTYKSLIPW